MLLQILTLVLCGFAINGEKNCDHLGGLFYEKINCTPKYKYKDDCPVSYDCPKFVAGTDYCVFQNVKYKFGEEINNTSYCNVGCFCDEYKGGINPITCAAVDCPWFTQEELKNCYETRELAGCCSTGKKCEPYDKVATCEFNNKTYMEGQMMDTGGTCWQCVCKKGFKGKIEEPFCMKQPCDLEIHTSRELVDKCAPIYRKLDDNNALCCPWTFLCPEEVTDLKIEKNANATQDNGVCIFNDVELNIGDKFLATHEVFSKTEKVTCSCILPPYVSCVY